MLMGLSRNAAKRGNKTQAHLHEVGERSSAVDTCMRCTGLLQEGHAQDMNWHVGHSSQMKTVPAARQLGPETCLEANSNSNISDEGTWRPPLSVLIIKPPTEERGLHIRPTLKQ